MTIARTPLELDELVQQAEGLLAAGDLDAALNLLSQVVEINPCHVRALNDLGTVCYNRGAAEYAIRFFCRALEHEAATHVSVALPTEPAARVPAADHVLYETGPPTARQPK